MAGDAKERPGTGQTRRRGAVLEEAILRAAADELTASGYAGLTMDKVAARAGTNKNALYRRWPNRLALGIAAYRRLATTVQPPDTGTLRGDALELLRRANRTWSSPFGAILRELLSAAGGASELLAQLQDQSGDAAAAPWLTVLGRAVARGEAPPRSAPPPRRHRGDGPAAQRVRRPRSPHRPRRRPRGDRRRGVPAAGTAAQPRAGPGTGMYTRPPRAAGTPGLRRARPEAREYRLGPGRGQRLGWGGRQRSGDTWNNGCASTR
ncbi:TetR/AcrR family transcriptional regulator [Streptomyces sp. NPDC059651]|uniref:TetR/AcrR family transcriptional regulator n=1 Tax=Streptomyces sp. NPDC059651 TaxID=3346897 RepID=UPI0036C05A55